MESTQKTIQYSSNSVPESHRDSQIRTMFKSVLIVLISASILVHCKPVQNAQQNTNVDNAANTDNDVNNIPENNNHEAPAEAPSTKPETSSTTESAESGPIIIEEQWSASTEFSTEIIIPAFFPPASSFSSSASDEIAILQSLILKK